MFYISVKKSLCSLAAVSKRGQRSQKVRSVKLKTREAVALEVEQSSTERGPACPWASHWVSFMADPSVCWSCVKALYGCFHTCLIQSS